MIAVLVSRDGFFLSDIAGNPEFTGAPGTAPRLAGGHAFVSPRWNGSSWEEGADSAVVHEVQCATAEANHRAWRDVELSRADVRVWDADDRGHATLAASWRAYRVALRDLPQQSADPLTWTRPEAPDA